MNRNPKQESSNLLDCKSQSGPCPIGCSETYYLQIIKRMKGE